MLEPVYSDRLKLRNWQETDRELFFTINNDDRVMEYFPFRRDRQQSDKLMDDLRAMIDANGFGFAAIELRDGGECVGFCGLHLCERKLGLPEGTIEIGWRLTPQFWGKGIATEAAKRWLDFGFSDLGLERIVSFAVHSNAPSLAVMRRIGMRPVPERDFDHPMVPDTYSHLKRHLFHEISIENWRQLHA